MAKLFYYHDTRSGKDTFPLKIRISHNKGNAYIGLGIRISPEQWDAESGMVVGHEKAKTYNARIRSEMSNAEHIISKLELSGEIKKYSANEIKEIIANGGEISANSTGHPFLKFYQKQMNEIVKRKTRLSYESALKKMMETDPHLGMKTFEDIDADYLKMLDDDWKNKGLSVNARAVYMRNIRAIINDARKLKLTTTYAFMDFSIKKAPTKKRNLSIDELRLLKDYPIVNEFQAKYRDLFMLCFYMRGINMVDLCQLTRENIRAGRINYIRSKTGKFYSVKIEPEMKVIFDRYKGQDFLLDICDGAKNKDEIIVKYEGFLQRMDRGLKKIGPYTRKGLGGKKKIKPILPNLSQYWSRHTTATLMAHMGYREEIIVCSLGHEHKNKTTNIYIEYNEAEVDKANRALIDFVNANDMDIKLDEKVAEKAKELADSMGMSIDDAVSTILKWYFEDCKK